MTTKQQIKALRDNIALVDTELNKNKELAIVWSNIDPSVLPKLDVVRRDLTLVLVDLEQQLSDAQRAL